MSYCIEKTCTKCGGVLEATFDEEDGMYEDGYFMCTCDEEVTQ